MDFCIKTQNEQDIENIRASQLNKGYILVDVLKKDDYFILSFIDNSVEELKKSIIKKGIITENELKPGVL
jgi:hypothetical protein